MAKLIESWTWSLEHNLLFPFSHYRHSFHNTSGRSKPRLYLHSSINGEIITLWNIPFYFYINPDVECFFLIRWRLKSCLLAISTLGLFSTKLFGNNNYNFFQVITSEILKTIIGSLTGVSLLDIKFSRYFSYSDSLTIHWSSSSSINFIICKSDPERSIIFFIQSVQDQ